MVNFFEQPQREEKESSQNIWQTVKEPKKRFFSKKRLFFGALFLLIISGLIWGLSSLTKQEASVIVPAEKVAELPAEENAPEEEETLPELDGQSESIEKYKSENFQINHINFGGESSLAIGDAESIPIEIYGVRNESFLNEKDNESKIAVSWKSNKMTISEVSYALAGGGGAETAKEDDFGFLHSVVLAPLEEGSAYVFSIKSVDHWGNAKTFGYYGAYSSAKADSIFELIGKTFGETFGWALNR